MRFDVAAVRKCLKSFDFQTLFREHLGWDNHHARLDVPVGGDTFHLTAVAQKRGFVAFVYPSIPDRATRLKIDHRVTKSVREHFVIYTDKPAGRQVWHWVRREPGKPLASRDHRFDASQSGDPLIQRLNQIAVSIEEEEEKITVVDVASRAQAAFDVDRVTKRFYDRFKAEHAAFLKLIKGIKSDEDLQWYTSLMLNRLMFVYFIQKKGFLDGDTDYLRNRLKRVQEIKGKDKFHTFYRYFLLRLFHEGLGKSPDERKLDPTLEKLLGRVPFLNGGFFEIHELEERWDLPAPRPKVFFVYAIECSDGSHYVGHTDDLRRRWEEHVAGDASQRTATHEPVKIAHFEEYGSREEAVKREKELKTGFGRKWLKGLIATGRARQAGAIDIPDEAFEKLFDFFDQYSWHLDERPLRADKEINPDVVGYIFEKYVNQKQMGAYYTKEDITEYISKNTVIPFIFDAARKKCAIAFKPDSALWRLLRDDPDRYIYPAVRHGVIREGGSIVPETELPDFVQKGMHDPKARMFEKRYNLQQAPAGDPIRLVTETWREYVYRRNRCLEIREKLRNGEVHEINDLITLNLDIWQFARDAIINCDLPAAQAEGAAQAGGPELLRAFWHAVEKITVLDPTCGSGAFLFAALRILETLYSDCLERMERFVEDLAGPPAAQAEGAAQAGKKHHPEQFSDFKKVLDQIAKHPSDRYFILKSIIINNLYGVDIMEEAVEICKLRLFLKLVAQVETVDQIEPLPDIDFNIRAGNTLVGFTSLDEVRKSQEGKLGFRAGELERLEEEADLVERAFTQFRAQQTIHGGRVTHRDKQDLRSRLEKLTNQLDRFLAGEYGVNLDLPAAQATGAAQAGLPAATHSLAAQAGKPKDFEAWKASHQPFHWFAEFYGIMRVGGFDVIIGNPPYLELRQVDYVPRSFRTYDSAAVHAMCIERSISVLQGSGSISMIVPLALVSTQRMTAVQQLIEEHASAWYANFAWRPGKLFDTVNRALTIFVACRGDDEQVWSANYQKWNSDTRSDLIPTMVYCEVARSRPAFWVPKLGLSLEQSILLKVLAVESRMSAFMTRSSAHLIYYRTTGGLYWKVFTDFAPEFRCNGKRGHSSRETTMSVAQSKYVKSCVAILSSNLFWWWYTITSNLRDLNPSDIQGFPVPESALSDMGIVMLGERYLEDLQRNSTMLVRHQKQTGKTETQCFKIQKSKPIIDEIDRALAKHYGFTDEELDFIINYDIKYRMGGDGVEDEE